MLTLEMIQDAKKTLEGVARVTPLYESAFINPNANVFIKCENMQVTAICDFLDIFCDFVKNSDKSAKYAHFSAHCKMKSPSIVRFSNKKVSLSLG